MLKLCRAKMTLPPHPHRPLPINSVILQIHELYTSLEAWHNEVSRPSKNALGSGLKVSSS